MSNERGAYIATEWSYKVLSSFLQQGMLPLFLTKLWLEWYKIVQEWYKNSIEEAFHAGSTF